MKRLSLILALWPLLATASVQDDINAKAQGGTTP